LEEDSKELATLGKKKGKKKNKNTVVHKQVFQNNFGGVVEITEVHTGTPGAIIGRGPTIIIGRGNLKRSPGHATPFKMFQEMDNIFDAIFENIAQSIIKDTMSLPNTNTNSASDVIDDVVEGKKADVEIKSITDITNNKGEEKGTDSDLIVKDEHKVVENEINDKK
jgi:hypothetical protein